MAQDSTPTPTTPTTPTTAADVANAKNRNLSLSQLAQTLGSNSSNVIAAITAIATAVTQKLLGGVVGTSTNRLLRVKTVSGGSSAGSVQNSTVICDDSGDLSGIADLNMSGTLTAATLNPTNPLALVHGGTGVNAASAAAAFDALAPTTTQGDLIYRNATTNVRLGPGTNGQFLQSQGAGANPQWATVAGGVTTIQAVTNFGSVTNVTITNIPATYAYLVLEIVGASSDTATRTVLVQVSTDNGSTYDSTAANYTGFGVINAGSPTTVPQTLANLYIGSGIPAATSATISIKLFSYQGGMTPQSNYRMLANTTAVVGQIAYIGSTSAITAIKILFDGSGNFDSGSYSLYGVK